MAEVGKLINELYESAKQGRQKYELRWYLIDNFYENNHFVKTMNQIGKLEPVKFPRGVQIRPIPRAKKQIKSIGNIITAHDPRWNVYPRPGAGLSAEEREKYKTYGRRINDWFTDLWYYLSVKEKVKSLVRKALKYNVGYLEIGGDAKGNIFLDDYDPYDIWHETGLTSLKESSWIIKGVSRTLQYVRDAKDDEGRPLYDPEITKNLKPENRYAISDWKNIRLQESNRGVKKDIEDPRVAKVFLKEGWVKDGDKWILVTECQGQTLREVPTNFKNHPFVSYSAQEGELYQSSPFEDLMPMNKAIDILVALIEGYTRTTAIGRLLKPKLSKVERVLNEHGEIVEYEGVQPPTYQQVPGLPSSVIAALNIYKDLMDEIGTSVVSFGKVPKGIKAARALESLKSSEFSNQADAIDLLERTLEQVAYKILEIGQQYFLEPIEVDHSNGEKEERFKLVSENSPHAVTSGEDMVVISDSKYMVKVEIESGLAYTEEGKREALKELADDGYLPKKKVLEAYKFSNVGEILEELEDEQAKQVSIVQTPEFQMLKPETRVQILDEIQGKSTFPTTPEPTQPAI